MSKLVDILARELKAWPKYRKQCVQGSVGSEIYFDGGSGDDLYVTERAEDGGLNGAVVTRTEWQAAVDALKAEKVVEWTGEGLPPVGTVCEIRAHKLNDWHEAKIAFSSRNVVVWDWVGEPSINGLCTAYAHAIEIRPIRTPEQIAAEERKTEILEMIDTFGLDTAIWGRDAVMEICGHLWEAGYRKQEAK